MKDWKDDLQKSRRVDMLHEAITATMIFGYGFASGAALVLFFTLP